MLNNAKTVRLFNDSTDAEKKVIRELVLAGKISKLQKMVRDNPKLKLEEMDFQKLRDLAREYRVKNYSRHSKITLLAKVREAIKAREKFNPVAGF